MENKCEKLLSGTWDDNAICAVGGQDYVMKEGIEEIFIHRAKEPGDFPKNMSELHAKMVDFETIKEAGNATKKFEEEYLEEERCGRLWNEPVSECMLGIWYYGESSMSKLSRNEFSVLNLHETSEIKKKLSSLDISTFWSFLMKFLTTKNFDRINPFRATIMFNLYIPD
jgi:hypothetical protein